MEDYQERLDRYNDSYGITHIKVAAHLRSINEMGMKRDDLITFDIRLDDNLVTYQHPGLPERVNERVIPDISIDMTPLEVIDILSDVVVEDFADYHFVDAELFYPTMETERDDMSYIEWYLMPDESRYIMDEQVWLPLEHPEVDPRYDFVIFNPVSKRQDSGFVREGASIADAIDASIKKYEYL